MKKKKKSSTFLVVALSVKIILSIDLKFSQRRNTNQQTNKSWMLVALSWFVIATLM